MKPIDGDHDAVERAVTPATIDSRSPERLRVAVVHSFYASSAPSGENFAVEAQAEAMERAGHTVRIVAARTDDESKVFAYPLRVGWRTATGWGPGPEEELAAFGPDVVHVHNLFPNWSFGWLRTHVGPVVATMHNFRPLCAAGILYRDGAVCERCPQSGSWNAVRHACYRSSRLASIPLAIRTRSRGARDPVFAHADRIVMLSEAQRATYERLGLPTERTVVIPNFAVDQGPLPSVALRRGCLFVGRLTEDKGIARLVESWTADLPRLRIIGTGPLHEVIRSASLQRDNIEFLGERSHDEVRRHMAESSCLVFPSRSYEAFPLVYVEALSVGLPVVAWKPSSLAHLVEADGTGKSVTWKSDLGSALRSVADEQSQVHCRKVFERKYSEDAFVEAMTALYATIVPGHRDGSFIG